MTKQHRNTIFATLKVHTETADIIRAAANRSGLTISAYLEDLALRADGMETTIGAPLPPRRAMHQESLDIGIIQGYVMAIADLAEEYCWPSQAYKMAANGKLDFSLSSEWDNRILRECGIYAPRGRLVRGHKRGPENKPGDKK
jgi:hypothetical protein